MECMRWSDSEYQVNYASDSSIGLAATDTESSTRDTRTIPIEHPYDSDGETADGEASRLEIVNENQATYTSNTKNHHLCPQCSIYKSKIYELRTMLMEQRRDDSIALRQLKKKFNKLVHRYIQKKQLLQQLASSYSKHTQRIQNIHNEMKRLSNNNHSILKEKHCVEKRRDELQMINYNLQLQINNHDQIVHQLQIKNVCHHS